MRAQLHAALPSVPVVAARAESLPLRDSSIDAVVVGQALHWFDLQRATAELRRVLRPGGGLGLVWNERDSAVEWVAELSRIIRWDRRGEWQVPYTVEVDWAARFAEEVVGFTRMERLDSTYVQELDPDTLVDRVLSTSYIAASGDAERGRIEERVRALVAGMGERIELPYVTHAYRCRREL
jgi:SAM-dependent methyltransferase